MNRTTKHSELDSELLPIDNPMGIFWSMGCLATGLSVVSSWLVLVGLMAAGVLPWLAWPYVALPITIWLVLLALPAFWISRRAGLAILEAIATTAEAWLARAGYSIDLNGDGYIGRHTITVDAPEVVRPVIVSSAAQGLRLLASDAPAAFADQELAAAAPPPAVWELANGASIDQVTLEQFIDGCFIRGWSRGHWVGSGKPLTREQHDGLLSLFDQAGIIAGRGKGSPGKLTLHTAAAIKAKLRLTTPPPAPG